MIDVSSPNIPQNEPTGILEADPVLYKDMPLYSSFTGWNYSMRRNMQEIIPGVFLGPHSVAQKPCQKLLTEKGVTHIVCIGQERESYFIRPQFNESAFTYLRLEITDQATQNLIPFFPRVKQFIDNALSRGGKVLIHGNSGNSRSATVVSAYIMEKFGLSSHDAYQIVKQRRSCVNPNEGFLAQLVEYEPIYKAREVHQKGESSSKCKRQKRKCDHMFEKVDFDLIQPPSSPIDSNDDSNDNSVLISDLSSNLYKLWLLKNR